MPTDWRALRRRVLTPNISETLLDVRGFHKKSPAAQETLETVGRSFLEGYGYIMETRGPEEAGPRLDGIPSRFRGFAYEGAAMGCVMLDRLPLPGNGRFDRFVTGIGAPHVYMAYVGVGWAMARLPRFRWPKPDRFDPLLRWLILDGYGFHQAYFRTKKYVENRHEDVAFPWPGDAYASRAIDQGIGRAMWFVAGTDPALVTTMIGGFPERRRADLYAGTGLAATYAGGGDADELRLLRDSAGPYRSMLAQGSAFAAEARIRAGLLGEHTELATQILCGLDAHRAAEVTQEVRPENPVDGEVPAYETWRQQIAGELATLGGVSA